MQSTNKSGIIIPRYIDYIVGMYLLSIPIESAFVLRDETATGYFGLAKMTGYLLFLVAIFHRKVFFSKISYAMPPLILYLLVFVISGIFNTVGSDMWSVFIDVVVRLTQTVISFQILYAYFTKRTHRVMWWFVAGVCIASSLQVFHVLYSTLAPGREVTFGDDPNTVAGIYGLGLVMIVYFGVLEWVKAKKNIVSVNLGRIIALLSIPLIIKGIVETGSRGGLFATVMGLVSLIVLSQGIRRRLVIKLLLAIGFSFGIYWTVFNSESFERWERFYYQGDTAHREDIFSISWDMIKERPLLGYGAVNNWYILGERRGEVLRWTHNQLLEVFSGLGLVGGLPYLLFLWRCFLPAFKKYTFDQNPFNVALFVTLIVICMSLQWDHRKAFWMILALCAAAQISENKKEESLYAIANNNTR